MKKTIFIILLLLTPFYSWATYTLPAANVIPWSTYLAGLDVLGGVPSTNWTQNTCAGLDNTGVTDAASAINSCITAAAENTVVYIPAGTYKVSGADIAMKSNVVLRGAGATAPWMPSASSGTTTLNFTGRYILFNGGSRSTNFTPAAPNGTVISTGYSKGSTTVLVTSSSGYSVGDVIAIYQDKDTSVIDDKALDYLGEEPPSGDPHVKQQYSTITGITGNEITFSPPIFYVTPSPTGAKIRKQTFNVSNAGVENIKLNRVSGSTFIVRLVFTKNCWVKGIETYNANNNSSGSPHVWTSFSYQNEYRDSYFHHGESFCSGRNYGLEFYNWNSQHKIENNIIRDTRHSIAFEGGGSGSAILYNYTDDNSEEGATCTQPTADFLSEDVAGNHGAHPHMNLFEGNNSADFWFDYTQGSSSHNTLFRNYVRCQNTTNALTDPWQWVCIEIEKYNRYYNLVGNVIGQASFSTGQVLSNSGADPAQPTVYRFGRNSSGGAYTDNTSFSTALIHGDYNYVADTVSYWQGGADHALSTSLYYSSAPSYWCNESAWPPVGPDVSGYTDDIPAKLRYSGSTCTTSGDNVANQFAFTDVTGSELSTQYTSDNVTCLGIDNTTSISITGNSGTYSINGGAYTSNSGTVALNDTVNVRLTSSDAYSTELGTTLNMGGTTGTYTVTTKAATPPPQVGGAAQSTFKGMSGGWK